MLVQCRPLFMGETGSLPIDASLDFTKVENQGLYPFSTPVRVTGGITARAGVVELKAKIVFLFDGRCDRCLMPYQRRYEVPMDHILVETLNNDDNDDYILLENYQLPLDDLVQMDILLELPYKSLCKENCRGLCPHCGKNLNEGLCGCHTDTADPRLEVLRQLIN